jgi:hypothetical protein
LAGRSHGAIDTALSTLAAGTQADVPQPAAARLAAIELWNTDSDGDELADEAAADVDSAAFDSAWDELAADLLAVA